MIKKNHKKWALNQGVAILIWPRIKKDSFCQIFVKLDKDQNYKILILETKNDVFNK